MTGSEDAKSDWVRRVLGIDLALPGAEAGGGTSKGPASLADVLVTWRDAKEAVDARLERLAGELRSYSDPDLDRIAELGIFGITEKAAVGLTAALMDFQQARAKGGTLDAAGKKLKTAIGKFRSEIGANGMVALIDEAPFSVKVEMRATLFGALSNIEAALLAMA